MKFEVNVERKSADIVAVRVKGDVSIATSPRLREVLKPLFAEHNKEIHVCLADVGFMDSSGIATLVEGLQWARDAQGHRFILHDMQDTVRDIFSLSKLDTIFDIAEPSA